METRGFGSIWCNWTQKLLTTSKSAVLVNGCPDPWIQCERGSRQGDALSLLPFSPCCRRAAGNDTRRWLHPTSNCRCCMPCAPSLQYADDTLIILRADPADVSRLKAILDQFAMATGLKINFHKSPAVPMHVQDGLA